MANVRTLVEDDLAKLDFVQLVVEEFELEFLGGGHDGCLLKDGPASKSLRVHLMYHHPLVPGSVPVVSSDHGGVAVRHVVGHSVAKTAVNDAGIERDVDISAVGLVLIPLVPGLSAFQEQILGVL